MILRAGLGRALTGLALVLFAFGQAAPSQAASTETRFVSSVNPSILGQSVTFSARVAGVGGDSSAPTGTVTFKNGSATLGSVAAEIAGASIAFAAYHTCAADGGRRRRVLGPRTNGASSATAARRTVRLRFRSADLGSELTALAANSSHPAR